MFTVRRDKMNKISGKTIANNIRAERNRAGLTQEATAKYLNISTKTYISYEEDARNVKSTTLYNLSILFKCNINSFYLNWKFTKCETTKKENIE